MKILSHKRTKRQRLVQPGKIGNFSTRNRFVMGPLCTMYAAPDGSVTPQMIKYYRARAKGGAAVVIVEITFIDDIASRSFHAQLGAQSDMMIPGLSDLAEAIKGEGAIAGIQIAHCGSQRVIGEGRVLAPSPIAWGEGKPIPEEMTERDINQVLDSFGTAASRLVAAGFDMIELQGAHGYLINTFISPATNTRTDEYGGSHENRMCFPLKVIKRIRSCIGNERLIGVRMNGHDLMPGGYDTSDYCRVAHDFEEASVDILHISAGTYRAMEQRVTPMYLNEAPFLKYASEIRESVDVPVIAAGTIHSLDIAENAIGEGAADYIAMSRPIFADPELPEKTITGREIEIIPCVRCNTCVSREQAGSRSLCAINPITGYEGRSGGAAEACRKIVIAGGGPGGMQTALTAVLQGHQVTLVEREEELGGALGVASKLAFKKGLRGYLRYLNHAVDSAGVNLITGTDITECAGLISEADDLVFAIGGRWVLPNYKGVTVIDPISALRNIDKIGETVVVIGADLIGAETAWHLAATGRKVTLTDRRADFGEDINLVSRLVVPSMLHEEEVNILFSCEIAGSEDGKISMKNENGSQTMKVDTVIAASELQTPDLPFDEAQLSDNIRLHKVGEASGLPGLRWATYTGENVARAL